MIGRCGEGSIPAKIVMNSSEFFVCALIAHRLFTVLLYFDHNATTFLAPEVAETLSAALREVYGNPSSIHRPGQLARQQLEKSRRTIASFLNASAAEIVFTSGGTEANNLAILGLVRSLPGEH